MAAKSEIPPDILLHIFTRLPAKTLGRFKCVSTLWRNLISDPYFVQKHLKTYKHPENLILSFHSRFLYSINTRGIFDHPNLLSKIVFSSEVVNPDRRIKVMGSCNGLIFLVDEARSMFLANPTTGSTQKIADLRVHPDLCSAGYGFGYAPPADEYVVIAIFYYTGSKNVVLQYSLRTDSWMKIEKSPYVHTSRSRMSGVLVKGNLHWLANRDRKKKLVIVAFDLVEKRFKEVPCPWISDSRRDKYFSYELVVLGGCLGLIVRQSFRQVCVCVMGEYGIEESWCYRFGIYDPMYMTIIKPLCLSGEGGEIVWEADGKTLFAASNGLWRCSVVQGGLEKFENCGPCLETLVSPQGMSVKNEEGWRKSMFSHEFE